METEDSRKKAIYRRQSKGKSEVENKRQTEICKEYLQRKFGANTENDILFYEDEPCTGSDIKRPQIQKMLEDIRNGEISTVISYELKEITRNLSDFLTFQGELTEYGVSLILVERRFGHFRANRGW